jgi:hypothetical protein
MSYVEEYFGTFKPEHDLYDLAQQYQDRCEAFDRTVCSGPIGRDGILPADYREGAKINRHAISVFNELCKKAEEAGYSKQDFQRAISRTQPRTSSGSEP